MLSINRAKEEIAEFGLGFMVHDKQIRSLCGPITSQEEQLFGYEVTVYRKWFGIYFQMYILYNIFCGVLVVIIIV